MTVIMKDYGNLWRFDPAIFNTPVERLELSSHRFPTARAENCYGSFGAVVFRV